MFSSASLIGPTPVEAVRGGMRSYAGGGVFLGICGNIGEQREAQALCACGRLRRCGRVRVCNHAKFFFYKSGAKFLQKRRKTRFSESAVSISVRFERTIG